MTALRLFPCFSRARSKARYRSSGILTATLVATLGMVFRGSRSVCFEYDRVLVSSPQRPAVPVEQVHRRRVDQEADRLALLEAQHPLDAGDEAHGAVAGFAPLHAEGLRSHTRGERRIEARAQALRGGVAHQQGLAAHAHDDA